MSDGTACIRRHHQLQPLRICRRPGADVDWILAGSGTLSGSAKNRGGTLTTTQRIEHTLYVDGSLTDKTSRGRNPWTERRPGPDLVAVGVGVPGSRQDQVTWALVPVATTRSADEPRNRGTSPWAPDVAENGHQGVLSSSHGSFRPLYVRFTNGPGDSSYQNPGDRGFSVLPNKPPSRTESSQTWAPTTPRVLTPTHLRGRHILEPINGRQSPVTGGRWASEPQEMAPDIHHGGSFSPMPDNSGPRRVNSMPARSSLNSGSRHRMPPLLPDSAAGRSERFVDDSIEDGVVVLPSARGKAQNTRLRRKQRSRVVPTSEQQATEERVIRLESSGGLPSPARPRGTPPLLVGDCSIPQRPVLARQGLRSEGSSGLRPDSGGSATLFTPPAEPFLPPVDALPVLPAPMRSPQPPEELHFQNFEEDPTPVQQNLNHSPPAVEVEEQEERALKFQQLKKQEEESVGSPPPPAIVEDNEPPASIAAVSEPEPERVETPHSAESAPDAPAESTEPIQPPTPSPPLPPPPQMLDLHLDADRLDKVEIVGRTTLRRAKRPAVGRAPATNGQPSKTLHRESSRMRNQQNNCLFPESLKTVEKPKESLQQCLRQMDNPDWQVTIQGLQTLVRLVRHHSEVVQMQLHAVIMALAQQIRNLRSQVSRAACQASGELIATLKRHVESDLDELVGPLFHRSADTNKFLQADCNAALDKMIVSVSPARAVSVLVSKGASHQNAAVRTVAARLLASLVARLGADKVMSGPRETRDRILVTGAQLLTEGRLETRAFAKQMFRHLTSHPTFSTTITEILPATVLRNIGKVLQSLN